MQKDYTIKIYDLQNNLKQTINPKIQIRDITFSEIINWGQGQMTLNLNLPFNDTSIQNSDIIRVFQSDKNNISSRLIYTWIIQQVNPVIQFWNESQEIIAFWLYTILTFILYKDWSSLSFNKNDDPANIIKDIISVINTEYNFFTANTNIDNYWTNINIDFENIKCGESLRNVKNLTDFYFYINQTWEVFFKQKPISSTHILTLWKDVESVKQSKSVEKLVNKYYLDSQVAQSTFEDSQSQTDYWKKEKFENNWDLVDTTTRDEAWNNYILENKDPKFKTTVVVNSNYDIESIKPWDTIKILNISRKIENLQVQKIQYSPDRVVLELDEYDSIQKEFVLVK